MLRTPRRDALPEALFIPHRIRLLLDKHPTGTRRVFPASFVLMVGLAGSCPRRLC